MVELLIDAGADVNIVNKLNKSALILAVDAGILPLAVKSLYIKAFIDFFILF